MYAVTGITGQVGGSVTRTLLDAGQSVRAVMHDAAKGAAWKERGCEVVLADMKDAEALTAAFNGVDGVFVMIPPIFDPTPGFPEARSIIAALTSHSIANFARTTDPQESLIGQAFRDEIKTLLLINYRHNSKS
jgi:NAD(P)H dehydrogenase (quinone)